VRGSAKNVFGGKKSSRREGMKEMSILENVICLLYHELRASNPQADEFATSIYGWVGMVSNQARMMLLYARSSAQRKLVKRVREGGVVSKNLEKYFGYGLFVSRK
jgi:hypothetical protein